MLKLGSWGLTVHRRGSGLCRELGQCPAGRSRRSRGCVLNLVDVLVDVGIAVQVGGPGGAPWRGTLDLGLDLRLHVTVQI